tara:strand:+ start:23 stop:454 length:432 start_codon:yes stop_codon:yes gene_type:complete
MKIIENFAELLHSEKLPEDFRDWFIWEENDSEKECKFFYSWFTPHFVRDTFFQLKTKFKFYRKNISNKDFEVQQKLLKEIPVFPYLENLLSIWSTRHNYLSSKNNWEVLISFPHEDGTEQYLKNLYVEEIFPKRFRGDGNETN